MKREVFFPRKKRVMITFCSSNVLFRPFFVHNFVWSLNLYIYYSSLTVENNSVNIVVPFHLKKTSFSFSSKITYGSSALVRKRSLKDKRPFAGVLSGQRKSAGLNGAGI